MLELPTDHGRKRIVADRHTQHVRAAEGAHHLGEGHDETREQAGMTSGKVILRRMRQRLAPISSPASSRLESIDINAAETNRKKKV